MPSDEKLTLCVFCSRLPMSPVPLLPYKVPKKDVVASCPACKRRVIMVHDKMWMEFTPVKKKEKKGMLR